MGIPAYFSYIVKNHLHIIQKFTKDMNISHFYLDSNSIIYDSIREIDFEKIKSDEINHILKTVVEKIVTLIDLISPTHNIYIAFDGVAPIAKLEQQRSRRYKSHQQNLISTRILHTSNNSWNTAAITPGTIFMNKLNNYIKKYFKNKYPKNNVILSLSDKYGEGEHKIFEFIRENAINHSNKKTVIYGLDADLIMLCINHLPICPNIYLYRETPSFIQSISKDLEPNESYMLDIPALTKEILSEMNESSDSDNILSEKVYDYIFICFFLGNDFLPHFPALNIRTGGITKLLNAYKQTIKPDEYMTNGKKIIWKNVRKFVLFLSENEHEFIKKESKLRKRINSHSFSDKTPEDKLKKFENTPAIERQIENYINIEHDGWETRYYDALFDLKIDDTRRKQICTNYLQGLEWTMKYYSNGCPDWRWTYKYHYPPLLIDLIKFIPYFENEFIDTKQCSPVHPLVQLCYVLPKESLYFLPKPIYNVLIKNHINWYKSDCEYLWAYCKYFWESHVLLPEINIDTLESIIKNHIYLDK